MTDEFHIPERLLKVKFRWWLGLDPAVLVRIRIVLRGWDGTPYGEGQRAQRIGVDCTQFCGGFADQMFRSKPTHIPRLQADVAMHNFGGGWASVKAIRSMHQGSDSITDGTIQPGDFIVTRADMHAQAPHRPAHVLIAGVDPFTAYHAIPIVGVCRTAVNPVLVPIIQIVRMRGKDTWR